MPTRTRPLKTTRLVRLIGFLQFQISAICNTTWIVFTLGGIITALMVPVFLHAGQKTFIPSVAISISFWLATSLLSNTVPPVDVVSPFWITLRLSMVQRIFFFVPNHFVFLDVLNAKWLCLDHFYPHQKQNPLAQNRPLMEILFYCGNTCPLPIN